MATKAQNKEPRVAADELAQLTAKLEATQKKLAAAQEELAKTTTTPSKVVPGWAKMEVETVGGDVSTIKVGIADGFPTVRPLRGQNAIVKSVDLVKLASGEKLEEASAKLFSQLGFGQEDAISFLEDLVLSNSSIVKIEEPKK